jgi:hypothetical protein
MQSNLGIELFRYQFSESLHSEMDDGGAKATSTRTDRLTSGLPIPVSQQKGLYVKDQEDFRRIRRTSPGLHNFQSEAAGFESSSSCLRIN